MLEVIKSKTIIGEKEMETEQVIHKNPLGTEQERKKQLKLQQVIIQQFKNYEGEMRFNIYGLGVDGYLYKKIKDGHGWIQSNMDIEYYGELQRNKDYREDENE